MTAPVIAFFPEASFGAALNCVGIAQQLQRSGAVPIFICHAGFTGVFAEYGFKEYHLPEHQNSDRNTEETWQAFVTTHLGHFNQSPLEQLTSYVAPTWDAIVDTAIQAEADLAVLIKRIKPDAIVLDNVIMFPAIANAGVPWIRVVSCAETELRDKNVPPYLSGMAPQDPSRAEFEEAYMAATAQAHERYNRFRTACGLGALPGREFLEPSPYLNLLLAPAAVRYERETQLPEDKFVFLDGCLREEARFDPPTLPINEGPIIYVSFGSLGAIDTELISRMIGVFATLPARFYVNVGGFMESYSQVPDNVYLGSWFPQPSIVEQANLFIHHGGNNSFCEALYFGVPSLIIPYCWDGHDNAQNAERTGTGKCLYRADWKPDKLAQVIRSLLDDKDMQSLLHATSSQMKFAAGANGAAERILRSVRSDVSR